MRISLNWLREYIDIELSPEELAHGLTMAGLEVENFENLGDTYKGFVVGQVLVVDKHPQADRLTVCKVDVGKETVQIVCGAPNVAVGQKVPVGIVGAKVPHSQHDPDGESFTLSQVRLRGVDSYGMICSAYELGLGEDKDGILVLESNAKIGVPLSQHLGLDDTVFDIGITPNRPDAMSHLGIAREISAMTRKKVNVPPVRLRESGTKARESAALKVVDTAACPRYTARILFNVRVGPSPKWLREILRNVGVRPVNNVVDVTNYVLMECGHPLHAFDYDKIAGRKVVVRCVPEGQSFMTLDHKERKLRGDTLMICDAERPMAVAGVMGGAQTEISDLTTRVLLESAYFQPGSIRRSSKFLGISTDASQRFERGCDPNITQWAVDRASGLMQEICGADVLRGALDVYPRKILPRRISLRLQKTNEILGTTLSSSKISQLLKSVGIGPLKAAKQKKEITKKWYEVPTFRPDLQREIDLIEEVARLYGYDNIEIKTRTSLEYSTDAPQRDTEEEIRDWLVGRGFREAFTNSMQDEWAAHLSSANAVEVANPVSRDMAFLRTSLVPSMLAVVRNNLYQGITDLRMFELGKVYFRGQGRPGSGSIQGYSEEERLILAFCGTVHPTCWDFKPKMMDIFDVKGEIEALFDKLSLDNCKFIPYPTTKALTESELRIENNGEPVGFIGAVRKTLLDHFDIEKEVYIAELHVEVFEQQGIAEHKFRALPKYPSVLRDLALVLDDSIPVEEVTQEIRQSGGPLLMSVKLFDIYRGNQIDPSKKSCAFSLTFRSQDHTLTQEEVDVMMNRVVKGVSSKYNASIRA